MGLTKKWIKPDILSFYVPYVHFVGSKAGQIPGKRSIGTPCVIEAHEMTIVGLFKRLIMKDNLLKHMAIAQSVPTARKGGVFGFYPQDVPMGT